MCPQLFPFCEYEYQTKSVDLTRATDLCRIAYTFENIFSKLIFQNVLHIRLIVLSNTSSIPHSTYDSYQFI